MISFLRGSLAALLLSAAPLGFACAQDQHDRDRDQQQQQQQQHPSSHQEQHPQGQHPQGGQQQHTNAPPPGQHPAGAPQFQRPAQTVAPQRAAPQVQRQAPPSAAPHATVQAPVPHASFASRHYGAAPSQFVGGHFYGRDYGHFTPQDRSRWQRGTWHREFLDGRYGWWFVVDGIWYFFTAPIYPFPTFIPNVVYIPDEEIAPPPGTMPPPAASSAYYYYCPDSQAYYPYVSSCASPWQPVPITPQ